jgi:CheY-like chemotaxis protein
MSASPTHENTQAPAHILIVDDDPIVSGMLAIALGAHGHQTSEVASGEQALQTVQALEPAHRPEVIFMDIDMGMGMDGYSTCAAFQANPETATIPVIFLSGHDDLQSRLSAYDAGGSDFIAKPFDTDEVLRKAWVSIRHCRHMKALPGGPDGATERTDALVSIIEEQGQTINFARAALGCRSLYVLAELIVETMQAYHVEAHIQLRTPDEILTLTPRGFASPLERSVIDKTMNMGRTFSFKNRFIVNYDSVSILIPDMPMDDESLCGRIRDSAALIAETAELVVVTITLRSEAVRRARKNRENMENLRASYRKLHHATEKDLRSMAAAIEGMYVYLGLTESQEAMVSDTVRDCVDRIVERFRDSRELDDEFQELVGELEQVESYYGAQEDEVPQKVELW